MKTMSKSSSRLFTLVAGVIVLIMAVVVPMTVPDVYATAWAVAPVYA